MYLLFDTEMINFLRFAQGSSSIIASIFLQGDLTYVKDFGNYIKVVDDEIDMISFLPKSKYEKVTDPWTESRNKIKIGKFISKVLTEYSVKNFGIDNRLIENFVNMFKSYFSRDMSKLKIVEGDDIRKYYLYKNYATTADGYEVGPLWNSCMRQMDRNKFMQLYSDNPDKVKMLVFFTDEGKIRARALLWYGVKDHKGQKEYNLMDRVYYIYDHDVVFFKSWAKENGFICKWEQSARSPMLFDDFSGDPAIKSLYVNLENSDQIYYPYLDTFKFFNEGKSRFSNDENYYFNHILVQSNGRMDREPEPSPEMEFDEDDDH